MFSSDQPILSFKEDRLGRNNFAKLLGNAILNYRSIESIVIGLYGDWGSGKTSVINMCIEEIEQKTSNDNAPIILNFNPWNYSDQSQLISQFFDQLSIVLDRNDFSKDAIGIGNKLRLYSNFFKPLSLIPTVGPIGTLISELLKNAGDLSQALGENSLNDLNSIKEEISTLLAEQSKKIIIVIDDIDRLNNNEIRQIFQLIKSLGDFPNTIYLLAFDKEVVITALQKVQEGDGSKYLEKVIQIPFDVPQISFAELHNLLFEKLEIIVKDDSETFDNTHWANIYHSGFKYFFMNVRHINRFINSLQFSYELVRGEVNPVDFIAITGLQVFMPEVYYGLRNNKEVFAGTFQHSFMASRDKEKNNYIERCNEIIGRQNILEPDQLKELLRRLFPKLDSFYSNTYYDSHSMTMWRNSLRVCCNDFFDIYFKFSIPKETISQSETNAILSSSSDQRLFSDALKNLIDNQKIISFLEKLEDISKSRKLDHVENIITVLMDLGDKFPVQSSGLFTLYPQVNIVNITNELLVKHTNQEEIRYEILKNALSKASNSLRTVVYFVNNLKNEFQEQDPEDNEIELQEKLINDKQLKKLIKIVISKIESQATSNELLKHKELPYILFRWKDLNGGKGISDFIEKSTKNDRGLLIFVASFLHETRTYGADYIAKTRWNLEIETLEEFLDLSDTRERLSKILSDNEFQIDEVKELQAIKIFLEKFISKESADKSPE